MGRILEGGIAKLMGRILEGGIAKLSSKILEDLEAISDITASVLSVQSVNTSELSSVLPRDCEDAENKYRYISRNLANEKVSVCEVMSAFIPEIAERIFEEEILGSTYMEYGLFL